MNFLSPIALLALSALAIPVLVHLWHTRKGRTLRIGSTRLFTGSTQQSSSSRIIRNWPLFLLRCMIIIVAVLLLAHPVRTININSNSKGWIVVTGSDYKTAYRNAAITFDSLLAAGYSIHLAGTGFEKVSLTDTVSQDGNNKSFSTWQTIRDLENVLPQGFPVFIFSRDVLSDLYGSRPASTLAVSIRQLPAQTTDTASLFTKPDPQTIRVGFYPEQRTAAATFFQAAMEAIADYTKQPIQVSEASATVPYDLLIAAGKNHNIDSMLQHITDSGSVIVNTGSDAKEVMDALVVNDDMPLGASPAIRISRFRTIRATGKVIWQTASGDPLLVLEKRGNQKIYHLAFNAEPSATGFVWDETFVHELLKIVMPSITDSQAGAMQAGAIQVDPSQLLPVQAAVQGADHRPVFTDQQDLRPWFWALLAILFLADRITVSVQSNRRTNG